MAKQLRNANARRRSAVRHFFLICIGFVLMYPLLWMVSSSFKKQDEIFSSTSLVPEAPTLDNYIQGWTATGMPFGWHIAITLLICSLTIIGNCLSCSLTAYAFGRLRFRGRQVLFAVMLVTIMLPQHVTLIAQYAMFRALGWVDTILPLVVPKFFAVEAFFIFLMVQFIRSIPIELDEAARIDGCGDFAIYWRIIMPLLTPAMVTTAIFSFIWAYNDFFSQLIYLSSLDRLTVPLALRRFLDAAGHSDWGAMFAMSILSIIPVLIVFVLFQRRIVEGMATTGLK
ncbi:carbohydrate ABC transporter permease [Tessaracoccus defluvii]|nr:carbohydrate ABC transporter permease [Tessaracoccus defluvii]